MDPVTVGGLVTALAGLGNAVSSWLQARRAALELDEAKREQIADAAQEGGESVTEQDRRTVANLIINPDLLEAMAEEMQGAEARFTAAVRDVRYTPAQVDQELAIARATICKHLGIIRDLNNRELPEGTMQNLWSSWC